MTRTPGALLELESGRKDPDRRFCMLLGASDTPNLFMWGPPSGVAIPIAS